MKQLLTLIVLAAIVWAGFSFLKQEIGTPTVRELPVGSDLTIDGHPVVESFAFTNARVIDGDSLRVTNIQGAEFDLRLASLDAPELNQAYGPEAKQHLESLLSNHEITAWSIGTDRYDRKLVFLLIQQAASNSSQPQFFEINPQMIRDGFAWHYKQHSSNPLLDTFENEARTARLGLWNDSFHPIPPWEFRNQ